MKAFAERNFHEDVHDIVQMMDRLGREHKVAPQRRLPEEAVISRPKHVTPFEFREGKLKDFKARKTRLLKISRQFSKKISDHAAANFRDPKHKAKFPLRLTKEMQGQYGAILKEAKNLKSGKGFWKKPPSSFVGDLDLSNIQKLTKRTQSPKDI